MRRKMTYEVRLLCASTVFHIYLHDENEASKLDMFLANIGAAQSLALQDLYNWCNRQKMHYNTKFCYNPRASLMENARFFLHYFYQKKYLFHPQPV